MEIRRCENSVMKILKGYGEAEVGEIVDRLFNGHSGCDKKHHVRDEPEPPDEGKTKALKSLEKTVIDCLKTHVYSFLENRPPPKLKMMSLDEVMAAQEGKESGRNHKEEVKLTLRNWKREAALLALQKVEEDVAINVCDYCSGTLWVDLGHCWVLQGPSRTLWGLLGCAEAKPARARPCCAQPARALGQHVPKRLSADTKCCLGQSLARTMRMHARTRSACHTYVALPNALKGLWSMSLSPTSSATPSSPLPPGSARYYHRITIVLGLAPNSPPSWVVTFSFILPSARQGWLDMSKVILSIDWRFEVRV
ncbi:hypothetical protein CCACVL1_29310 [Corchorus capsularis]|uniref:Uncharacterized protein n=1 Tax=Corchorus capsularis TaxID=210143 RepID=A0A1R3G2E8_COCAP|nr:hypothetical protein CCACVL1_29310 [Corchorus capsularis]